MEKKEKSILYKKMTIEKKKIEENILITEIKEEKIKKGFILTKEKTDLILIHLIKKVGIKETYKKIIEIFKKFSKIIKCEKNNKSKTKKKNTFKKINTENNNLFPENFQNYHFYLFLYYYIGNLNKEEIYEIFLNFCFESSGSETLEFEQNGFASFLKKNEKNLGCEIFFKLIKFYDINLYEKLFIIQKMLNNNVDIKLTNFIILRLYSEFSNSSKTQKIDQKQKFKLSNICFKKFLPLSLSFFLLINIFYFAKDKKSFISK